MHSTEALFIFALGFCFYFSLHYFFRQIVLHVLHRTETDAYVISCRIVSAIQATIAVIVGAVITASCQDIMKDVHWLSNTYLYFGFPYFLYDTWAMYAYNVRLYAKYYTHMDTSGRVKRFIKRNKTMFIHHIFLPGVLFPLILMYRNDRGDFFLGVFYMIEMVVPLMSFREILVQLNLKYTRLYTMTSISIIVMFFVCRILVFPYLYQSYASYADISIWSVPAVIPLKCNLSCLAILTPQIYWFSLMIRMLKRAVTGQHREKCTDNNFNSYIEDDPKVT